MWPVVLITLILGILSGFVMHRADFCMTGAFRDLFLFRHVKMLQALLLLVTVTALASYLGRLSGLIADVPYPLFGAAAPANVIGGILFGIGMVLCGSCVVGTLYRLGAGSKLAAVALVGLICGSALYAEIHPWWKSLVVTQPWRADIITLPQALHLPEEIFLGLLTAATFTIIYRRKQPSSTAPTLLPAGHMTPYRAALLLALIGIVSVMATGMPLGITTAYAKVAAQVEYLLWPAHVETTAFFQALPLDYIAPLGKVHLRGGAGPAFDGIAAIQYPLLIGITGGAAFSALLLNEWRLTPWPPRRQLLGAFSGGIIMALGSRITPGCNVWHLWGGLPIFALQSLLFLGGLLPGAWLGGLLLTRFVLPATVPMKGVAHEHSNL